MKKVLGIMMAVAMVAGLAAAEVYSQNVVGYIKFDTPTAGNINIVALGQISPDGVHIQDAISNMNELNAGTTGNYESADKIFLWDGGYTAYGLFQPSEGEPFWMRSGGAWSGFGAQNPADVVIERGQGVWFQTGTGQDAKEVIVSGEVPNDVTGDSMVDVVPGVNLIAFPYSATVNMTNLVVSGATAAGVGEYSSADKIHVWDGGYTAYGLFQPAEGEPFWMRSGGAWSGFGAQNPADVDIELGKGFWYEVAGVEAKTIGFSQPYTLEEVEE